MNIVIVGGGTAGWITALYAKKVYPKHNIVLVESEDIGILGAGEGSTPSLVDFFYFLDIPISDLIRESGASLKNGIKFSNWSNSGGNYFHPFGSNFIASNDYNFFFNSYEESDTCFSHIVAPKFDHGLEDYSFMQKVSYLNKVPFLSSLGSNNQFLYENSLSNFSLHFNAQLLAKYLRSVAEKRGVVRKEGLVEEIFSDEDGYIFKIRTNKEELDVDFVFDCTGFKRLIIGNFYKSKWKSHEENLPVNKAIPFFVEIDEDIPPYTEAIAMDAGWMWKIPVQGRYGCGYVFDERSKSIDDAKKEIDDFFGYEVDSPKSFSFNAGYFEEIWIKNALSVGLSSGFIEPLEATSIWQSIISLNSFFASYGNLTTKNQRIRDSFNKKYSLETQDIVDFLFLHYITNKNNSDFWRNFTKNNKTPEFIEYLMSVIRERPFDPNLDFMGRERLFNASSYYYVMIGNEILNKEILKKQYRFIKSSKDQDYLNILDRQNDFIPGFINHRKFLSDLEKYKTKN